MAARHETPLTNPRDLDQTVDVVATKVESRVTDMIVRLTLLGLFVFWALDLVGPFLPVVIWSVLLAVALYPVHAWLAARLGGVAPVGGGDPHALPACDRHRPGRGARDKPRRGGAVAGRRPRPGDPAGAAPSAWPGGLAPDRREGPGGLEPRRHQSRGRGEAVRALAAAGRHRDPGQARRHGRRRAAARRLGGDRGLPLRAGAAARRTAPAPSPSGSSRGAARRSSTSPARRFATSRAG